MTRHSTESPKREPRDLSPALQVYLAELRVRLATGGASDEEIGEAEELLRLPQLFTFYKCGATSEYSDDDVLRGMKGITEGVIIPELKGGDGRSSEARGDHGDAIRKIPRRWPATSPTPVPPPPSPHLTLAYVSAAIFHDAGHLVRA